MSWLGVIVVGFSLGSAPNPQPEVVTIQTVTTMEDEPGVVLVDLAEVD